MARKGESGATNGGVTNEDDLRIARGRRGQGKAATAQMRPAGRRVWNGAVKQEFLEVLAATCNVREACRAVEMTDRGAYQLRQRDPGFAAQWQEAVEQGYAELEMVLLRQSIFGSETTEIIDDGTPDGVKRTRTVHSYPHATALRLMLAHKGAVDAGRQERGIARPGSEDVRMEIQRRIETVRLRIGAAPGAGGAADTGHIGGEPERDGDA